MDTTNSASEHNHDDCHQGLQRRKTIALVVLLFLLGATTGVSMLYISAANSAADKDEEISSLRSEIGVLKQSSSVPPKSESSEELEANPDDIFTPGGSQVEVSNFSLKLERPLVPIVEVEGGPISVVRVGTLMPDGSVQGNYEGGDMYSVSVGANSAASIEEQVQRWTDEGRTVTEAGTVQVDGQERTVYQLSAMGSEYHVLVQAQDRVVDIQVTDFESPRAVAMFEGFGLTE
jgi:hypothetical protein